MKSMPITLDVFDRTVYDRPFFGEVDKKRAVIRHIPRLQKSVGPKLKVTGH